MIFKRRFGSVVGTSYKSCDIIGSILGLRIERRTSRVSWREFECLKIGKLYSLNERSIKPPEEYVKIWLNLAHFQSGDT